MSSPSPTAKSQAQAAAEVERDEVRGEGGGGSYSTSSAPDATSTSTSGDGRRAASLVGVLTKAAHVSAPFISTFLLIHLTAPVMANVGGSELSSKVQVDSKAARCNATRGKEIFLPKMDNPVDGVRKRRASVASYTSGSGTTGVDLLVMS